MKWVPRPIMKPKKKEDESKSCCYTKTRRKEPTGLIEWISNTETKTFFGPENVIAL